MNDWVTLICPACWQKQDCEVEDPGEGEVELVTDCEICCRPMTVRYWRGLDGGIEADIQSGND